MVPDDNAAKVWRVASQRVGASAAACVLALAGAVRAEESHAPEWTLAKEKDGFRVYHLYASPDDAVPRIRVTGTLDIPYDAAGVFIWDPEFRLVSRLNEYIAKAETIPADPPGARRVLYVFRIPWGARAAVRIGSVLLGSVGSAQYTFMDMQMQPGVDETRISWTKVPVSSVSAEVRQGLSGFEVLRNSGSWLLQPADGGRRTAFQYELDAFPGGNRVPPGLVRWSNGTCVRVPRLIEDAYRAREQEKAVP